MEALRNHIKPGRVYRRSDLEFFSTAVDRHLSQLRNAGALKRLGKGLYYVPKESKFGLVPPDDKELVKRFLMDESFLLLSPNAYNSLGLGATQLYNTTWVYNHKRRGEFKFNGKTFIFKTKSAFPKNLSQEYLVVDLLNNLKELAEDPENLVTTFLSRLKDFDPKKLMVATQLYGSGFTKKLIKAALRRKQLANA
jgi:hypothetical protein